MDAVINVDRLTEWCVIVRLRGRNFVTVNPLTRDMSILDRRVKRAEARTEWELAENRQSLIREMLNAIFGGDGDWVDFNQAVHLKKVPPVADIEGLAVINNYTMAYYAATGQADRVRALALNPLSLIAEDDAKHAAPVASDPLPAGRVINGSASRPITPADVQPTREEDRTSA